MAVEYELKFRATTQTLQAIDDATKEPASIYHMQTTYYDTADGALSQRFYTLRRRQENDTAICTLKAPIDGFGRGEWELPCDRIQNAIAELCKLGAPADLPELTQSGLIPLCGAKFTRIAKTVPLPDCTVELALDQGVLTGGGRELPLCEVEVELKAGKPESCLAYARQLALAFGLHPENNSKFRRALALSRGEI